jgi:GxxExxY protein
MPVHCPIDFPRITDEEMGAIDYAVMSHAFAAQNELGRLADEVVYQEKLIQLLHAAGIEAVTEVPIKISFRNFSTPLAMDLVVESKVIYELKATSQLLPAHESQLLSYLYLNNATHGKLVNFRSPSVKSKFINSNLTTEKRQQFEMNLTKYHGESELVEAVGELIADWGTGLNTALYRRAILPSFGDEAQSEKLLDMTSAGRRIGKQRFHLLCADTALGVTSFKKLGHDSFIAFQKLITASPLRQMQWLNITHGTVTLSTIASE